MPCQGISDYWRPAMAGASIGGLCGLMATPLEQVKTVMALQDLCRVRLRWKALQHHSCCGDFHRPLEHSVIVWTPWASVGHVLGNDPLTRISVDGKKHAEVAEQSTARTM